MTTAGRGLGIVLTAALLASGGCGTPRVAEHAAYEPPRWPSATDLAAKADCLESETLALVDDAGLLLHDARVPWDDPADTRRSHDLTGVLDHQGQLMAALAFKAAALAREDMPVRSAADDPTTAVVDHLRRLAGAFTRFYEVTGEPGLAGSSMLPGYTDPEPLPWMRPDGQVADPPWIRSPFTGEWWREGVGEHDLVRAVFGCAVPLALERRGELTLDDDTRAALVGAMVPMIRRVVRDDWFITDRIRARRPDAAITPEAVVFPDGYERVLALHLLCAGAPYDEELALLHDERLEAWSSGIGFSNQIGGLGTSFRKRWEQPGDLRRPATFALAACSVLLQTDRPATRHEIRDGLRGWWGFMKHEANAPYTIVYAHFALSSDARRGRAMAPILAALADFPGEKIPGDPDDTAARTVTTPGLVQPLANRPLAVDAWSASVFELVERAERRDAGRRLAAADYLLAYWMARYFGLA